MSVQLAPNPVMRFYDNNNYPLAGGQLYTYQAGTTTPAATYTDSTQTTQNPNPVIMNARGEAAVWLVATQSYKFVLKDASGNTIWTQDNITAPVPAAVGNMTDEKGSGGQPGFVAGVDFTAGTTTTLTLSLNYGSASNLWVAFDAAEQGADQFSLGGTNNQTLTFTSPIPLGTNKVYVKGGTTLTVATVGNGAIYDVNVAANAAINSSKFAFLQNGTGAVTRTGLSKMQDIINALDFGVDMTGATDSTAKFLDACSAAAGGTLFIPAGTLLVSTLTIPSALKIKGAGGYKTTIQTSAATGDVLTLTDTYPYEIEDVGFAVQSGVTRASGSFINVNPASSANSLSLFRRLLFSGGYNHLTFTSAGLWGVEDCYFANQSNFGINANDTLSPDSGDSHITGCIFDSTNTSSVHINQGSSGGLRVIDNKFLAAGYHYLGQFNTGAGNGTSILIFEGNSSENAASANIALNSSNNTSFQKVSIKGNQFSVSSGVRGVEFINPGYNWLDIVDIGGNQFSMGGGSGLALSLAATNRLSLQKNSVYGTGAETGVYIDSTVTSGIAEPQDMFNLTTWWTGGGLANLIYSPGRRESGTAAMSITTAQGSLFTGTAGTVTFAQPYAVPPSVKLTPILSNGVISAGVDPGTVTTTGFSWQAFGTSNTVTAQCMWEANG